MTYTEMEENLRREEERYWEIMRERYCHNCACYDDEMDECEDCPGDELPEEFPDCYVPSSSEGETK